MQHLPQLPGSSPSRLLISSSLHRPPRPDPGFLLASRRRSASLPASQALSRCRCSEPMAIGSNLFTPLSSSSDHPEFLFVCLAGRSVGWFNYFPSSSPGMNRYGCTNKHQVFRGACSAMLIPAVGEVPSSCGNGVIGFSRSMR
jgi:hypothetical protein